MNRLQHETSPYLLQHAHNPVDWFPWGDEALQKARAEDKPILVSIGYAACHWCHVMERESFENAETAELMNTHFVNIKIDREERPDLDHIYMDAVQAMSGSGGWPLNVFLTPEGKPFYGGTYFPPKQAYNRPSWRDVLLSIATSYREKKNEIEAQAENLTEHLRQANAFGMQLPGNDFPGIEILDTMARNCLANADTVWGGFGNAPKFPQTFTIQYLLRYYYHICVKKRNDQPDTTLAEQALKQATLSLDKMIDGGIYDQAGGGFARYSTDAEWLAPHFEKMLYDNALLVSVLADAYQLTKKERYREVIHETMDFIKREMLDVSGGFYAALDADSEGVEGKFYVWDKKEVESLLGNDADVFCRYYNITDVGNWEHKNILRVLKDIHAFAAAEGKPVEEIKDLLKRGCAMLMEVRASRIRPQLDDKVILGWNALMNTACSRAYAATGDVSYRVLAVTNMQFMLRAYSTEEANDLMHTWKQGWSRYPAFLDDYAYLVQALIALQEVTADPVWLEKAGELVDFVINRFSEEETGFFFYTRAEQTDIIVRKKEVYDGAVPSGNAIMALNLKKLGLLLDRPEWADRAGRMALSLEKAIVKYPGSFGCWADYFLTELNGIEEIAIIGDQYQQILIDVISEYIPFRVVQAAPKPTKDWALLRGKPESRSYHLFLCRNYVCLPPVFSLRELIALINRP